VKLSKGSFEMNLPEKGCAMHHLRAAAKLGMYVTVGMLVMSCSHARAAREVGSAAEWLKPALILVHTPGEELFSGVLHPEAALYEQTFSIDEAKKEHLQYIKQLKAKGIEVVTVEDALLKADRDELIKMADDAIHFDADNLRENDREDQKKKHKALLSQMDARVLVRAILQRPTIRLAYENSNLPPGTAFNLVPTYTFQPVMNLYFTRDQMITTANTVVLSNMKKEVRRIEPKIMEFVLTALKIPVRKIVKDSAVLEGGDFIPAGERAFIGMGDRTNEEGVHSLLNSDDVFGTDEVVVVKESWHQQQESHLDTYFNVIDRDLVVLVEDRHDCSNNKEKCLFADVWRKGKDGRFSKQLADRSFVELLKEWHYDIIPVSVEDQKNYGVNFLTVGKREIFVVRGISGGYRKQLKDKGVDVHEINFDNMKLGYGAAHCTTQVLHRSP
jgi:arginine deiminase